MDEFLAKSQLCSPASIGGVSRISGKVLVEARNEWRMLEGDHQWFVPKVSLESIMAREADSGM